MTPYRKFFFIGALMVACSVGVIYSTNDSLIAPVATGILLTVWFASFVATVALGIAKHGFLETGASGQRIHCEIERMPRLEGFAIGTLISGIAALGLFIFLTSPR